MLKKSSPLKFLGQIKPNLAGSIILVPGEDASCQVWFNLAKEFQRRRFF
jgi:hypothetical protein